MNRVCSDDKCPERRLCSRWHRRNERAPGIVHVGTLRKAWHANAGMCDKALIEVRNGTTKQ